MVRPVKRRRDFNLTHYRELYFTSGMYVNLDRRGINDLIRHLRRARDQAFGRDE